jgi:uncharacterized protein (TIGR02117 family)
MKSFTELSVVHLQLEFTHVPSPFQPRIREIPTPFCTIPIPKKNKKAWDNFNNLAPSYRKQYVGWLRKRKKKETVERRIEEAIKLLTEKKTGHEIVLRSRRNNHIQCSANRAAMLCGCLLMMVFFNGCSSIFNPERIKSNETADFPVYVVDHGGHTGVILERELAKQHLPYINEEFVHSRYIEVGWGDEDFYQSREKTTKLKMQAVLYPTNAVLRVTEVPIDPEKYYPNIEVKKLMVTRTGFRKMLTYIYKTLKRNNNGNPVKTGKGLHVHDLFYHANGKFHVFNTCNTWTAKILKEAGLPVSSFLTITSGDIMNQIRDYRYSTP